MKYGYIKHVPSGKFIFEDEHIGITSAMTDFHDATLMSDVNAINYQHPGTMPVDFTDNHYQTETVNVDTSDLKFVECEMKLIDN